MGRPIKKNNFGNITTSGAQVKAMANLGTGVVSAYVVKQTGSKTYKMTNGTLTKECKLVNSITTSGEATITVLSPAGSAKRAKIVLANRVKTFEGDNVVWGVVSASNGIYKLDNG